MKQITTLLVFTTFLVLGSCKKDKKPDQNQVNYHFFSGELEMKDNSTCLSADGNLLICGNEGNNLSIIKISKSGSQLWRKDFNPGYESEASSITELNGSIFVCGRTGRNYASNRFDLLLVKANASGDTIWTKTYGSTEDEYGQNIIKTSDGNILISAITEGFGAGSFGDIYLVKVDPDGNVLWESSYSDPNQEVGFHLMETQNGEYLVTGTNEENGGSGRELYLLKVSASGQQLWSRKIDPIWKWGFSTIELTTGELVTCGQRTIPFQQTQVMLIKTDNTGNVIWEKEYGSSEFGISEEGNSVKQNMDGGFTICGSVYDINDGSRKIILLKTDENGNQIWFKKFNDYLGGSAYNLLKDGDDNILTGNKNGNIFMTRTDANGNYN